MKRVRPFAFAACFAALLITALALGAAAVPAPSDETAHVDKRAIGAGRAAVRLWLRGRYFSDVLENGKWDPSSDKAYVNKLLQVGRMSGKSFVSVGSATTDSMGAFDIKFTGTASGTYYIYDVALAKTVHSFEWATDSTSSGQVIAVPLPKSSTKTRTSTRAILTTKAVVTTKKNAATSSPKAASTSSAKKLAQTSTTKTKSTTVTRSSSTTRTTTCGVTYDGKTLPWLSWKNPTSGGENEHYIDDIDVDSNGDVLFCGYTERTVQIGSITVVSSGSRERAFVGKVSPNGTVRWLQVVSQDPNDSAKSRFRACQLTPDGTKFMVSGYMQFSRSSSDPTITFGEKNYTQKGYADGLIAHLNPADGKVQHLIGVGVPGGTGYMNSFDRFAKGPSGTVMYLLKQGYHGGVWSDGGSNVDCSDASPGGCMIVVKYTGTTRNWVTEIWNDDDWQGGIALTSDGAKVIAGTVSAEVRVLDSSTGAILVNKTISGMEAVRSITTIGSDIYVLGNTYGTMSVDSITHSGLPDVTYTSLIRLTLSGNTLTANKAIWMGGNESTGVDTMFISKAYGSAGGTANRLLVGINLLGSTFMAGNGYKKVFGNTPAVGYWYGTALMVLLDSSTFNITSINNIGAQNDGWAPLETYNFPNAGYSSPTTGSIYIGGSVQQTHNATCRWNFTMDGWWSSTSASDFNVFPFIAKFTKDLEWPEVRM